MHLLRMSACVLVLACVPAIAGETASTQPTTRCVEAPGVVMAAIAFTEPAPRLFPAKRTWFIGTTEPVGKPDPFGLAQRCEIVLDEVVVNAGVATRQSFARIPISPWAISRPDYAIRVTQDAMDVAFERATSATTRMVVGRTELGKQASTLRLNNEKNVRQFVDGRALSSMDNMCPSSLTFVRGSAAGPDALAVCGRMASFVCLSVPGGASGEELRWDTVRVSSEPGAGPRGVWLAKDKIALAWIVPGPRVHDSYVELAILSKTATDEHASAWQLVQHKKVYAGPARLLDLVRTENQVVLGILELTSGAPRVVIYRANDAAEMSEPAGAMELAADGAPVDFSIDDAAERVAVILSLGGRKDNTLVIQPVRLVGIHCDENARKQEYTALERRLDAEWKAKLAEEAPKPKP